MKKPDYASQKKEMKGMSGMLRRFLMGKKKDKKK